MPQGVPIYWSYEHEQLIKEWMEKYPKGKSINLKQIEYSEPEKFKEILAAGHPARSIQDKAYAIAYKEKKPGGTAKVPVRYAGKSTRATPLGDGRYKCNECGEIVPMKQALPGHYRKHQFEIKTLKQITSLPPAGTGLRPKVNNTSWHFCPNCAFPLDH